jgi:hypothetical protein
MPDRVRVGLLHEDGLPGEMLYLDQLRNLTAGRSWEIKRYGVAHFLGSQC